VADWKQLSSRCS